MPVLSIAHTVKLLLLDQIGLDGCTLKANAPRHKALFPGQIKRIEAHLPEEVQARLAKAGVTAREERTARLDLPAELAWREARPKVLTEIKAEIEARARDQVNLTGAESRIMPISCDGFEPACNVQAATSNRRN